MSVLADRVVGLLQYLMIDGDDENNRLLEGLVRGLVAPADRLSLVCEGDGDQIGPWQVITDPSVAPLWALPAAAQYTGGKMPTRMPGEGDDAYLARARDAVVHPLGMLAGSAKSLMLVAKPWLVGTQTVVILQVLDGSIWNVGVQVLQSELTPGGSDFDVHLAAIGSIEGWWKLNGNTLDSSGNGNNGTNHVATFGTPGAVPGTTCATFTNPGGGAAAYIEGALPIPAPTAITLIALVNTSEPTNTASLAGIGNAQLLWDNDHGQFAFLVHTGAATVSAYADWDFAEGWHLLIGTCENGTAPRIYVDGVLTGAGTVVAAIGPPSGAFQIGDSGSGRFTGSMQEVAYLSTVVTDSQAADLWAMVAATSSLDGLAAALNDQDVIGAGMKAFVSFLDPDAPWTLAEMESRFFGRSLADLEAAFPNLAALENNTPEG